MTVVIYIIRFLLAFIFIYAGIEKLFMPYDLSVFRADVAEADSTFFIYYDLLRGSGYLYFVGFFQLLCGLLLVFKRPNLFGAIMLITLILCLLMTHICFSKYIKFIIFDAIVLSLNILVLFSIHKNWKPLILKTHNTIL